MRLTTLAFAVEMIELHKYKRAQLWDVSKVDLLGFYEGDPKYVADKLSEFVAQVQGIVRVELDSPRRTSDGKGGQVEVRGLKKADAVCAFHLQGTLGGAVAVGSGVVDERVRRLEELLLSDDDEEEEEPRAPSAMDKAFEQLLPLLVAKLSGGASAPITGPPPAEAAQPAGRPGPVASGGDSASKQLARALKRFQTTNPEGYAQAMSQLLNAYGDEQSAH